MPAAVRETAMGRDEFRLSAAALASCANRHQVVPALQNYKGVDHSRLAPGGGVGSRGVRYSDASIRLSLDR